MIKQQFRICTKIKTIKKMFNTKKAVFQIWKTRSHFYKHRCFLQWASYNIRPKINIRFVSCWGQNKSLITCIWLRKLNISDKNRNQGYKANNMLFDLYSKISELEKRLESPLQDVSVRLLSYTIYLKLLL